MTQVELTTKNILGIQRRALRGGRHNSQRGKDSDSHMNAEGYPE